VSRKGLLGPPLEWRRMNLPIAPPPEAVKQPTLPKLRDVMGPGLITGASDDDPSGIATYSQAGVQFAYSMGWTLLSTYPLMCAIQLMACSHELACAARGSLRSVQKLSLSAICRIAVDRDSALSPA
jgi:hypothetical protein